MLLWMGGEVGDKGDDWGKENNNQNTLCEKSIFNKRKNDQYINIPTCDKHL